MSSKAAPRFPTGLFMVPSAFGPKEGVATEPAEPARVAPAVFTKMASIRRPSTPSQLVSSRPGSLKRSSAVGSGPRQAVPPAEHCQLPVAQRPNAPVTVQLSPMVRRVPSASSRRPPAARLSVVPSQLLSMPSQLSVVGSEAPQMSPSVPGPQRRKPVRQAPRTATLASSTVQTSPTPTTDSSPRPSQSLS